MTVLIVLGTVGLSGIAEAVPGTALWGQRYNGPGNGVDAARRVVVSPDGSRIYVTGASVGSTSGSDYATIAYNASTGKVVWGQRYNGPGNGPDAATAMALSPNGTKLYVTGSSVGSTSDSDYATVAYNAATGAVLWSKRYNGPGNDFDEAKAVVVSPDGTKVAVTGRSLGSALDFDYATIVYNAVTGTVVWATRFNAAANFHDEATAVAVSPDGTKIYVTGSSWTTANTDYVTIAYNATTGAPVWGKRYNGPSNTDDVAGSVVVSPNGTKVYVTGGSPSTSATCVNCADYATVAYNATTGAVVWTMRYNGPAGGADSAAAVAVSPDGAKVYVTGQSEGSAGTGKYNYATVAYNAATGAFGWAKRYDGPGNGADDAYGVVVSPDSTKVYVTGDSFGSFSNSDYETIAYSAS